jgi:ABC-type transport system involved in multi-copper enzyme maturation permease subunit
VPGYTAGAIVGERERQTLGPMQVTLLSPRSIVLGKLLASLAYLSLLVVATVPLLAAAFLFGGVTIQEMLKGLGMVMVTGVLLASISLAVSALGRRSQSATVMAYGLTLMLVLGTFAFYGFENVASPRSGNHNKAVLVLNPLVATADAVAAHSNNDAGSSSPLTGLRNLVHQNNRFGGSTTFATDSSGLVVTDGGGLAQIPPAKAPHQMPYAAYSLLSFAVLALAAFAVAVRRIRTPAATDRA